MWSKAQHVVVIIMENILQGAFYMLLSRSQIASSNFALYSFR